MATMGARKGRTHVLEKTRILFDPIPVWISEFQGTVLGPLSLLENVIYMFLSNAQVFIYVQQEVLSMAHTPISLPKENPGIGSSP
jgi:hypothetical protein